MYLTNFFKTEFENRPECVCWFILPKGKIGNLSAGQVTVQPGGSFLSKAHTEWRQVYFVIEGRGTLIIDGKHEYPVGPNTVAEIPYNADHEIRATHDGPLRYIYINDSSQPVQRG